MTAEHLPVGCEELWLEKSCFCRYSSPGMIMQRSTQPRLLVPRTIGPDAKAEISPMVSEEMYVAACHPAPVVQGSGAGNVTTDRLENHEGQSGQSRSCDGRFVTGSG
jgi:hypothetical protein